ncbi:hypothetical protein DFH09DRAFT_1299932 [Mycena vulgaris]|nr:hypothetical protein DFH09DRAFT_1299932 [Mycena vulgaris]
MSGETPSFDTTYRRPPSAECRFPPFAPFQILKVFGTRPPSPRPCVDFPYCRHSNSRNSRCAAMGTSASFIRFEASTRTTHRRRIGAISRTPDSRHDLSPSRERQSPAFPASTRLKITKIQLLCRQLPARRIAVPREPIPAIHVPQNRKSRAARAESPVFFFFLLPLRGARVKHGGDFKKFSLRGTYGLPRISNTPSCRSAPPPTPDTAYRLLANAPFPALAAYQNHKSRCAAAQSPDPGDDVSTSCERQLPAFFVHQFPPQYPITAFTRIKPATISRPLLPSKSPKSPLPGIPTNSRHDVAPSAERPSPNS